MKRSWFMIAITLAASATAWAQVPNLVPNPGFEDGLAGWTAWGDQKRDVATYKTSPASGALCARIPAGNNALYTYVAVRGGHAYLVSGKYRLDPSSTGGGIDLSYVRQGGANGSAGQMALTLRPGAPADAKGWMSFSQVALPPKECVQAQFVLRSGGEDVAWYDDLKIEEVALPPGYDPNAGAWDGITKTRTQSPLFAELLGSDSGDYYVTSWAMQLYAEGLPEDIITQMNENRWQKEMATTFRQMGENHLGALALPWAVGGGESPRDFWRNEATLKDLNQKYKLRFDCAVEHSGVLDAAARGGAEVLGKSAGGQPRVSPVDPKYVAACVAEIEKWARMFGDEPYCRAFEGMDEPSVPTLAGERSAAGPFMAACDQEVREKYGFGKYGMPAPADPSWWKQPADQPFCWIAFNRWMADKFSDAAKTKFDAVKKAVPGLLYTPCDLWFMSGLVPFDMNRLAKYSDYLQGDPYASSAEVRRGRGVYNHGFGAKLLHDIGAKHVQIVLQAFDYAGYKMTPDDLLEWSSQALRSGADRLCFYHQDNPRFTDPARWKMMLHISKTVSEMKAIKRPTATKTAIFYSSMSLRAEGPSCLADEVYTAYALLGEKLGCWFDFVSDLQVERGTRKLSDYKVIYLPLGTYQDEATARKLMDWVKAGGTLICGDPTVWSFGPDGADLSALRSELFGIKIGRPTEAGEIALNDRPMPVYPAHTLDGPRRSTAHTLVDPQGGLSVLGKYPDETAAVVQAAYGTGKAILFGVNPFVPDAVVSDSVLEDFIEGIQKAAGEPTGLDIWRFKLPTPK